MKKWSHKHTAVFFLMLTVCLQPLLADEGKQCENKYAAKVTSDAYFERAGWRLMHGVSNVLVSPSHLVLKPMHASCSKCGKGGAKNVALGVGEGVVSFAKYAVLGAWDIVTFWVPGQAGKDIAVTDCAMKCFKPCC